jgi:hypothetical protein
MFQLCDVNSNNCCFTILGDYCILPNQSDWLLINHSINVLTSQFILIIENSMTQTIFSNITLNGIFHVNTQNYYQDTLTQVNSTAWFSENFGLCTLQNGSWINNKINMNFNDNIFTFINQTDLISFSYSGSGFSYQVTDLNFDYSFTMKQYNCN